MNSSITKKKDILYTSIGILLIFIIWFISSLIINNEIALPSIKNVFNALYNLLINLSTYKIVLYTVLRILISLIIGITLGITLGALSYSFKPLYSILSPFIKIMRALPIASIILIILIMFGMKGFNDITFSPIIVTNLLVIPLVFEAVYKGINNIDKTLIDVALLDTSKKSDLILKSYIPLISNEISIALSQSIGLAFKAMVMAEYISQTQTSIGYALLNSKTWLEYDKVFAWTIILIFLSILFEGLSKFIKRNK